MTIPTSRSKILKNIWAPEDFGALTPSDSTQGFAIRGVFVGTGGDIAVKNLNDETITFKNVADGTYLPVVTETVLSTGTTATDLVRFK